jgi:hypothetical protein
MTARSGRTHRRASQSHGGGLGPALLLVSSIGQTTVPEMHQRCDMQRSIPRFILETIALAAMVVLLLYVLVGSPS